MKGAVSFRQSGSVAPLSRLLLFVLSSLLLGTQCARLSPEEQAALAAKGYYTHLAAGEYELFLQGKAGGDSLPGDYREQLLTAYKQFMAMQQRDHRGIREVTVSNARADTLLHYADVFLMLCYGDSTQEEIVVPMVEHDGRWRMR